MATTDSDAQPDLKRKVQDVLNEARILVLGDQVLLGFQYQALFYPGFERLPPHGKWMNLGALSLSLLVLALLLAPTPFHRITESGADTARLQHYAAGLIATALPLIAISLALDLAVISEHEVGQMVAALLGLGVILAASALWIAAGLVGRKTRITHRIGLARTRTSLADKVQTLLTEARVILPGAQALLGFQFAAMLSDRFETLPHASRLVHVGSLFAIAASVILLIAPAAYHRIAADGEARQDVDTFGAAAILGSLVPLSVGLVGDLYVISESQFGAPEPALAVVGFALAVFAGLWLVYPILSRTKRATDDT